MNSINVCQAFRNMCKALNMTIRSDADFDGKGQLMYPEINGVMINYCPFCGEKIGNVVLDGLVEPKCSNEKIDSNEFM